ncbi:MAG TPA: YncE family protein [Candidatus Baltobacteraceae bacterium]|nr:YncE family protein [Candidatus Baltobacteraceae bacterium]
MPILPFLPPQTVQSVRHGEFDYITVDPQRRRVYCAHGGNSSLLIVNADTGKVLGQVRVGDMAGVAVNAATGDVYTGDGDDEAVSEVNPATMKEVHRVSVPGHVDAIAYDAQLHRIYADEDDGTRIFVVDTRTFKHIATIALPGHKPEYIVIDPKTHYIYQNIATNSEIAVIDPHTLKVVRTIATPEVTNNHPLQLDEAYGTLLVGGGGKLSEYTTSGKRLASVPLPRVDQCSLDQQRQLLACAGTSLYVYKIPAMGAPVMVGSRTISRRMHNVGVDGKTGRMWITWGTDKGDFVQGFTYSP